MKNLKKGLVATLAIGLALSISAPVFATENTESEEVKDSTVESSTAVEKETIKDEKATESSETIKKPLKAAPNAVTAKTDLSFEIGAKPVATDFVTINDDTNKPTFTFKNGAPTTATAGNYSTVILVTFDDATSVEVTADYTVKAATPLATLKTTAPVIAQDSKPNPKQFADAESDVILSFKSGTPSTKKTGSFTTIIVATKGTESEELVVKYSITDQTPPTILIKQILPVIKKGDTFDYKGLITVYDNSGKFTISYKPGHEANTSKLGYHEAIIIVTDEAGNTQEATLSYFVSPNVATLKTPVLDEKNSTAKVIYGKTSSNVTVEMFSENGDLIATTMSDSYGNFTIKLEKALKENESFSLIATSLIGNYSDYSIYSYIGQDLKITEPTRMPYIKKMNKIVNKKEVKVKDPKKSEGTLPKTGDESSLPLTAIGLLLASGTVIVLRKKQA
ncbi:LPXTG cell wall anchor domain-containing protein [Listeria welshimeri]|uniref:LPXTG cell wall anchor domain-containing protein n=1 Tax=Listeria welshimeri TaxID=1643 RepID=UPI0018884693|nr:LPXTG cell wall anchor domain-containing protein [Listeria welshimeri]MBF2596577.1 LPXTG cell wall anchor domain-containing protein [Listeria welshimeri]